MLFVVALQHLQAKIVAYESMAMDLERRLEDQALQCMKAENESILIDKKWAMKFEDTTKVCETTHCVNLSSILTYSSPFYFNNRK
jgi:hypothetical protein